MNDKDLAARLTEISWSLDYPDDLAAIEAANRLTALEAEVARLKHDEQSAIDSATTLSNAAVGLSREVLDLRAEVARLRELLQTIECPCCGEVAAYAKFFEDGQETICGCGGIVMCDGETADVSVDECERPECGADDTALAPASQKDVPRG